LTARLVNRAIVRPPTTGFAQGLSAANEGPPDIDEALEQHRRYCDALRVCGLEVIGLSADMRYPDGTFVEDTAVVTSRGAILTRPGAPSRTGEIEDVAENLCHFYPGLRRIAAPGTVDGGDVCEADGHFFIGLSLRTNEQGANQLAGFLREMNYTTSTVDIRGIPGLLHLKTGIAYLGDGACVVGAGVPDFQGLEKYQRIPVDPAEAHAANCVRINDHVLLAAGYPQLAAALRARGYLVLPLEVSEFRKMDGGLSCLSLRF
jgi:dimethylargininase